MAEWSGFFDAHKVGDSWDRTYLAEDFAKFFAPLIGNGIFAGKSNELQVFQDVPASMSVVLSSGQSWIEGYGYVNDSDLRIPVDPADGALGRIDRVVNQWSSVDRRIRTVWKKGTPAVNPVAPPLRWDADYKELNICILDVSAGISAITQDKIRDTRADSSVCGWVTGLIDQVDTSTLFAQWESAYEKEFTEQKRAWEEFFKDIQLDLGIPVPSPDKAKRVLAVDSNGGYILSDEYASKEYADTRHPYNYLDNSDFTNPVNQRGKTSYAGTVYGIDRWYGRTANQTVSLESGNVTVTARSTSYAGIKQKIENIDKHAGKTVTLACRVYSTKSVAIGFVNASDTALKETVDNTSGDRIIVCTYEIPSGATFDTVIPRLLLRTTASGDYMRLYWAALYEGEYTADNLPVYQPKGYGAELAECLRYFERQNAADVHAIGTAYYASSTTILRTTIMYHPKRIVPTVTLNWSDSGVIVNGAYETISKTNSFDSSKTMSVITFETSGGVMRMPAVVYAIGYIDISADL